MALTLMVEGASAQNTAASLLRLAVAALAFPPIPPAPEIKQGFGGRGNAGPREIAWLRASTWTIVIVLGLLFCFSLTICIFGLSYLDLHPGHSATWHFQRYRLPVIIILTLGELALVAAIIIRDYRRLKVEKLLHDSEERSILALGAADVGLWQWDAKADYFWMSEHCRTMFAIPSDAELGLAAIAAAIHPDDQQIVAKTVSVAHETGTTFEIRFRITIGDGKMRWVRSRGRVEVGSLGRILRITGTAVNISEHMTMQAEIDRQRQSLVHLARVGAIGELSGALAHELNQPLTAILSNAQAIQRMLRCDPISIEDLREAVADIIEDDSRAGDLIRHLRALLKNEEMRIEPINMCKLVDRVMNLARNELIIRHVEPVIQVADDAPPVLGDAVQLQQLLLNLILNAVEAIGTAGQKNGVVMISGYVEGPATERQFHLSVSDTGPGISSEVMEKLFEPFFSTKKQGLGIGLSICHAIVTRHGGTIRAEGNSWSGATFQVYLPLAPGDFA